MGFFLRLFIPGGGGSQQGSGWAGKAGLGGPLGGKVLRWMRRALASPPLSREGQPCATAAVQFEDMRRAIVCEG